jgi:3-hydroxyisobutyrate dehydrogenase-like beta-hydroxyacid dehydrogenase
MVIGYGSLRMKIALIGFGEAGLAIATSLAQRGGDRPAIRAFDIKLASDDDAISTAMAARISSAGVDAASSPADAVGEADIVISVVTADQAATAAALAARYLPQGALYLDMNSCAPTTKQIAAGSIEAKGGTYVDVAVMAPIEPRGHETPMLAAAPDPEAVAAQLAIAGLHPRFVGDAIGRASTIKMLRSVMVKGIEALTAECFRAAVRAGVAEEVATSLDASQTGMGWAEQAAYNMERMTAHGIRRAAEMREVAKTLRALDIPPAMTTGTIAWQDDMGALDLTLAPDAALAEQIAFIEQALEAGKDISG